MVLLINRHDYMKRFIISMLTLVSITCVYAQSPIFEVDGIYYRLLKDTTATSPSGMIAAVTNMGVADSYEGSVSIPGSISYNGAQYPVTAITDMAFKGCKHLSSISIPASVITIPAGAFYGCNNLESIRVASGNMVYDSRDNCNAIIESATNTLIAGCKNSNTPNSVTSIGECAFYGCNNLSYINIPNSITSIGKYAFLDCSGLYSVVIPESITCIEDGTFEGCTSLTSIVFPSSIKTIGNFSFYGCNNLSIEIPTSVTGIGRNAFNVINTLYWNQNSSPASVLSITQPEAIVFGDNVTSINYYRAFSNCQRLKSITIPASVKTIHRSAFEGLYNLETINWNTNVSLSRIRLIENSRTTLKTFILGDSVTVFDWFLLRGCTNLETISVDPSNPVYDSRNNCNAIIESVDGNDWYESDEDRQQTDYYYYINSGYYHKTKDRLVLGCKNTVIPNTVTSIREGAFVGCTGLTSIYIPASVKKINSNPFVGCNELSSIIVDPNNTVYDSRGNCNAIIETQTNTLVTGCNNTMIPSDLSRIGGRAFSGCSNLASITIPSSVTFIGGYAFEGCSALKTISIPENITSINDGTFFGCTDLTSIQLSSNVNYLGHEAFYGCCSLPSIVIPSGVTRINFNVFNACSSLTSVTIPAGVDTILSGAFRGCCNLPSINIPAGVTCIQDYVFADCNSLTSLTLPSGISFIAPHLVEGCSSLESINIPSGVDSIGEYAFSGCSSLKSVIVPESVTKIYFDTFTGCNSLSYLSIPSSVTKLSVSDEYIYDNRLLYKYFEGCDALQTAGPKGGGFNYEFDWDTIPANAFRGLDNLISVYIPKTVKAIYECNNPDMRYDYKRNYDYNYTPSHESGFISAVFYGCNNLESVAVSFKDTKLMRLWRESNDTEEPTCFKESPMDFNLYRLNHIKSLAILNDSVCDLKNVLTESVKKVIISEYVCSIDSGVFSFAPYSAIVERSYFDELGLYKLSSCSMASNLESISVELGNLYYSSVDGVLLNKDGSKILLCPSRRKNGYSIPETVIEVTDASFKNCIGLDYIRIPASVKRIGEMAFYGCESLDWVTFEGSPQIGKNSFDRCYNISSVTTHSPIPGIMQLNEYPQTISVGDYEHISGNGVTIKPQFNNELDRIVSLIYNTDGIPQTSFTINADKIVPPGSYKISVGILPSPDDKIDLFYPHIYGYNDSDEQEYVFNPVIELDYPPFSYIKEFMNNGNAVIKYDTVVVRPGRTFVTETIVSIGYDTVVISDYLVVPDGLKDLTIKIEIIVPDNSYSPYFLLDRIFFEPLDNDLPRERFAGPFTENVFNNATLYVPDGAVSTYQAAEGWNLFKNIAIEDAVDPIRLDDRPNGIKDRSIYDFMGRKVEAESIEQLAPGLYVIGDRTYLIQ